MIKRIVIAVLGILLIAGILAGVKALQIRRMVAQGQSFSPPPETVTTADTRRERWEMTLKAVGSLVAVQGVTVSAELPGKVVEIAFKPGSTVRKGDLLLRQNTSSEEAQLRAADAAVELARQELARATELFERGIVPRSSLDNAEAQAKEARAQADNIRATIAKKTVRAPFGGRLGIRLVNLGQILSEGQSIVTLQTLDPIFVDFQLPQQELSRVAVGLPVRIASDAFSDAPVSGTITAMNPEMAVATRTIGLQATVPNPKEELRPGMFVTVAVVLPAEKEFLVVPATAVLYAPYSDSVFVVEEHEDEKSGESVKRLRQQLVRLGERRGDFVAVVEGLKEGESVVSTGVFKLRGGQAVVVDNSLAPEFKLTPRPEDH